MGLLHALNTGGVVRQRVGVVSNCTHIKLWEEWLLVLLGHLREAGVEAEVDLHVDVVGIEVGVCCTCLHGFMHLLLL